MFSTPNNTNLYPLLSSLKGRKIKETINDILAYKEHVILLIYGLSKSLSNKVSTKHTCHNGDPISVFYRIIRMNSVIEELMTITERYMITVSSQLRPNKLKEGLQAAAAAVS